MMSISIRLRIKKYKITVMKDLIKIKSMNKGYNYEKRML